jgi:hypothetical protein
MTIADLLQRQAKREEELLGWTKQLVRMTEQERANCGLRSAEAVIQEIASQFKKMEKKMQEDEAELGA